ncbi:MAG: O-methyltransferase [Sporolactobacillus sp.]
MSGLINKMKVGRERSATDFEQLSRYTAAFSPSEDERLRQMEEQARAVYIPIMHPPAIALIQQMIHWTHAKRILELGTAIGYSAIRMRLAAGQAAHVTSVERDAEMISEAQKNIAAFGFADAIHIIHGDALTVQTLAAANAPYDLLVIDAAKGQYEKLFQQYSTLVRAGGIVITDNVLFHGLICEVDQIKKRSLNNLVRKIDEFNHFLAEQPNFDTVFLTVGDGLALSTKLAEEGDSY